MHYEAVSVVCLPHVFRLYIFLILSFCFWYSIFSSSLQDLTRFYKKIKAADSASFLKHKSTTLSSGLGPPSMLLIRLFQPFTALLSGAVFCNRSTPEQGFLLVENQPFICVKGNTSSRADTVLQHLENRSCNFLRCQFWYILQNCAKNTVYTYPSSCWVRLRKQLDDKSAV